MYDFKFADVGEGLHEGQILKWHFKEGDKVKEGDLLVVVETDKVNAELTAPVSGVIKKVGKKEGEIIHVGETVVIIDDGSGPSAEAIDTDAHAPEQLGEGEKNEQGVIGEIEVSSDVMASSSEGVTTTEVKATTQTRVLATPVARKLAKDLNVDITKVKGSGEHGRVTKEDIKQFASQAGSTQAVYQAPQVTISKEGQVELVPITKLRKAIVKAMTTSKQVIPHTVLMQELVVDKLVDLRQELKAQDLKLTYMPFITKAVVKALKLYPVFNSSFDQANDQIVMKQFYNIGMAVDTPDGLIVPVIKNADQRTILGLSDEIKRLGDATKERKVQLADLQNATFSITNFGSIGVPFGTPVINHPEVAILGVGMISQKPIVKDGQIVPAYVLPLSLAVDHRIIDGADAGRFLNTLKLYLENPSVLLVD